MKDEEMAEEYKESKRHKCFRADAGKIQIEYEAYLNNLKEAFLAGLKAGRPQWHDLRKDPADLPKDVENYICLLEDGHKFECYYDPTTKKWYDNFFHQEEIEYGYKVIAWCETPTFDKE